MNAPVQSFTIVQSRPHALHADDRLWPQTNCYTDLWIEILAARNCDPHAMLGFTVTQDFEGDQFTFFKPPLEDLEFLYGVRVSELSIFDNLQTHIAQQLQRGRMPLVEVDSFYLPDTRGVSYQIGHQKTTIGIQSIDVTQCRLEYFHNSGFYNLGGTDYLGCMQALPEQTNNHVLFPYTECIKFPERHREGTAQDALRILSRHLIRRPLNNPIATYAQALNAHLEALQTREPAFFHPYSFNTIRQLGANHELLATHLDWLTTMTDVGFQKPADAARSIAESAKVMQFQLARALQRGRFGKVHETLKPMIEAWNVLHVDLDKILLSMPQAA